MVRAMSAPAILHEDARLLAIAKPEGISAIPERDPVVPSIQRQLEATRGEKLFVVHRIDKEVSGLLLFARTAAAHRQLSIAFERRRVDKRYLALAWGRLDAGRSGEIDQPIHEFGSGRMGVDPRGKPSITRWAALANGRYGDADVTLLALSPHTGRRHQLRVHLYAMGHALVGDPRYGDAALQAKAPRLALHAAEAHFAWEPGALDGGPSRYDLHAPPPPSMIAILSEARVLAAV